MTDAVVYLRRRTVTRSLRSYVRWVGRAIGWWTVGYLIFWLVVFSLSAVEALPRSASPLPGVVTDVARAVIALWLLTPLLGGRVPPVHLDSRDLYRLALAPVAPRSVIAYRLRMRLGTQAMGGAAVGGLWAVFAASFLHEPAPWAPVAIALLAMSRCYVHWLRYSARAHGGGPEAAWATLLPLVSAATALLPFAWQPSASPLREAVLALSPTSALSDASWLTLIAPLVLVVLAALAVRRSLASEWPPRFAAQSLVLAQLRGLRSMQLLSAMAGLGLSGGAEPGERDRLIAALHDRPGSVRPRRSLRRPDASAPAWQAVAWRTATAIYRRPVRVWLGLGFQALVATAAGLLAAGQVSGAGGTASAGGAFGGALAVLLAAFLTARAAAPLLGPLLPTKLLPVAASTRNLGRVVPVFGVLAALTLPALLILMALPVPLISPEPGTLLAYAAVAITTVLALEKYSSWSGAEPGRLEPQLVAAVLVALPALVLQGLGYPDWVVGSQVALLVIVSLIEV